MRIGLFLVSLALLATPAMVGHSAPEDPKAKPAARLKLPINLRGTLPAQSAPQSPPGISAAGLALKPHALTATPSPVLAADTGQCRADCGHSYYFCLSGQITTDCSATWSQCVVNCSHPPLTIEH